MSIINTFGKWGLHNTEMYYLVKSVFPFSSFSSILNATVFSFSPECVLPVLVCAFSDPLVVPASLARRFPLVHTPFSTWMAACLFFYFYFFIKLAFPPAGILCWFILHFVIPELSKGFVCWCVMMTQTYEWREWTPFPHYEGEEKEGKKTGHVHGVVLLWQPPPVWDRKLKSPAYICHSTCFSEHGLVMRTPRALQAF